MNKISTKGSKKREAKVQIPAIVPFLGPDRINTKPAVDLKNSRAPEKRKPLDRNRAVYFAFMHPHITPGGAQLIAYGLHVEHLAKHGPNSSLFIGAMFEGGPRRPAGSNLIQLAPQEFLYVCAGFDYQYFTNFDVEGQRSLLELIDSFGPAILHFHHFMALGLDFIQACLARYEAKSVFTVHEHLLVCHNNGHLLQNNNNHVCREVSYARCATCMPQFRYDYFQHRMAHFARVMELFDKITAVSAFTAKVVKDALGLKKEIDVIPNGPILQGDFAIDDLSTLRIAFIGQIHPTKGVHLLLQAVEDLCTQDWRLPPRFDLAIWGNIVGPDAYKAQIQESIARLTAMKVRVTLNGVYDAAELPALLFDRNVVVVPSLWPESYCLTADEALQAGKILVCSEFPAIRERYGEGNAVRFFPMGSVGGLKMRLTELLANTTPGTFTVQAARTFGSFGEIYDVYRQAYEAAYAA